MPVTDTWLVPFEDKVHDRVAPADPMRLVGDTAQAVLFVVRLTTPLKPSTAVTATLDVAGEPARTVTMVGLAVTVKSWIEYVTVAL